MQDYILKIPTNDFISRRGFVKKSLKGLGAVAIGSYTITALNSCTDSSSPTAPASTGGNTLEVNISKPENQSLATIGGTLALNSNVIDSSGLLLFRESNSSVKVFSRRCTHQGCTTGAFQNGVSTCPCHSSKYNTSGGVISGPAPAALKKYSATLDGDIITITS